MAQLSIVIPAYNTDEKLLSECISSILNGSLKDVEIVVVDDGSTKDYSKLTKKFATKIKYFKTENQGTMKARFFGVKKATSPYICFADSDDTMSWCYYDALLAKAKAENADICFNNWAFHTEQTKYYCGNDTTISKNLHYEDDIPLKKFFAQAGGQHSFYVLWNKIFKKEILDYMIEEIEKLGFEKLVFSEDVLMTYFAFKKAQKVVNVHLGYYFYRIHASQEIAVTSKEKLTNHILSMAKVFNVMETDLKKEGKFDDVKISFGKWKRLMCSTNYQVAKRAGYKDLYPVLKEQYGVEKLQRMPRGSGKSYANQHILPSNIDEVDTLLKKVYYSNKYLKVYAKRSSYAFEMLVNLKRELGLRFDLVSRKKQANIVFCKERVSLKQRILHNEIVYRIGILLFPKGSKIRQLLKSKL